MSLSNSTEMEYQLTMMFQCVMEEAMSMLQAEEAAVAVGSGMLFLVAGFNNDINVLNQSPLFVNVIRGYTTEVSFTVNGHEHHIGYYPTDGIYPS
jgi:hypothetical protein